MKRNKTASRWISCLLCMAMMLSLFSGITVLAAEEAASGKENKVLFSTQFKTQEEFSNFADVPVEVNATLKYGNSAEDVSALIDGSTSTKLCATDGVTVPLEFTFHYNAPTTASNYYISGANDDEGNPGRTLNSWELYGTNDQAGEWTLLDKQSDQTGWKNYEMRVFQLPEGSGYQHYKLKITKFNSNPGTIQFSGFGLTRSLVDGSFAGTTDAARTEHASMTTTLENDKLVISGHHEGNQSAQVYNVLYTGLNIPVTENTRLVYNITPQQPLPNNKYDYDFYSMHLAVDLKFTDGTYLSSTGLEDENGVRADPNSQGEGKAMLYAQENQILIQLGALKGKTIEKIDIGYANSADLKADGGDFKGTLNSIRIENVAPLNYSKESLVDYAYILRGTNNFGGAFFSRGLTGPMVAVPHGFNFWAPENDTGNTMFDYNAGYIRGFRCSHEPSIWVGDRSVWRFMPGVNTSANGRAIYDQENVTAKPYYFSVQFNRSASNPASGVRTELSPTDHGMITRITYPENAQTPYINISDVSDLAFDIATQSFSGYKKADSNQMPKMYIYGTFDQAFTDDGTRAVFGQGTQTVVMRAATSFISAEQAKKNLELELSGEFDAVKADAKKLWNDKLSQFEIEGASEEQRITFYSCLYRLYLYPNNMGEKTGEGGEGGWQYMSPYTKTVKDGKLYYNNGFWDTYRTTWAAYSLFTPKQNNELLLGLIHHFEDSGWMPRWIAPAGTNSMVGTSSDVIFADAMLRGATLTDEQWQLAYQSALKNASMSDFKGASGGRDGIDKGLFLGYTPGGSQKFSWSIEGYINDAGIANMAKELSDMDAYTYYKSRATNYVNLFRDGDGVENKWLAAKNADGSWTRSKVDPFAFHDDYTETTALNMACSVPQDGQGLANLYGGRAALAEKLDQLFETTLETDTVGANRGIHERREAQEVKMGEYGHSNQPSHHIPYMYLYAGRPDRTQEKVRQVLRQCYVGSRIGQGYIGDEDIRLGSLDGKEIATLTCKATGNDWSEYEELSGELTEITKGMHDVYLYFENNAGKTYIANVDWFRFTEASSSHEHSWSSEWSKDETHHWHACSGCDEKNDVAPHTPGAAATEIDPQICTVCGYIIAHATGHIHHTTTLVPAVEATCVAKGHRAYYTCSGCSKLFADENATEELTEADVTPKTDPTNHVGGTEVLNAKDATYTEEGYTGDTCCKSCHAVISYGHVIPKLTKPSKPSGGTVRPVSPNAGVGKKPEAEKDALPFTDVPQTAWYYESVQSAWAADLIDGVTATKFKPDDTLTVAQAIKLAAALYQMEHEGEVTLRNGSETWYDSYVSYAVANGIIEKDYASYTAAHMNAAITRAEFVHIFHGAESTYKAINQVADGAIPDVKSGDAFASDIYEFYRAGILTGSDAKGTFHPASSIKRSEVATILLRMFEAAARVSIDLP